MFFIWGLGIGDWAQIPNPQSPIPKSCLINIKIIYNKKNKKNRQIYIYINLTIKN